MAAYLFVRIITIRFTVSLISIIFVGNIKSRHPVAGRLLKYIAGYNAMRAGRKDVTYNEIHNLIIDL